MIAPLGDLVATIKTPCMHTANWKDHHLPQRCTKSQSYEKYSVSPMHLPLVMFLAGVQGLGQDPEEAGRPRGVAAVGARAEPPLLRGAAVADGVAARRHGRLRHTVARQRATGSHRTAAGAPPGACACV